ncbi:urea carboxylase-associated family protein [Mesorhizobium sp.]|uniref:urea carboxylase-associated family protein n=1 Tax=Mesorhizobium sp. TaxID=1871066 RepID=UPI000FE6B360|nr:urea carboxylase-associated family protein [Mesorhizobium sp.]RWI88936.1 MAG: urea carboxylase-associated family protein [Mesorhizobium sp.]
MPPFPKDFFESVREARPNFTKVDEFRISPEEGGKAFEVKKGQSFRLVCVEGPQIADMCIWNAHDYKERFWNDYTINREGIFVSTFTRLWSNMPKFRPMMTIIEDTVFKKNKPVHEGARHHYIFGAHCNPHVWYWATGDKDHPFVTTKNCWCNLTRAVKPFGMTAENLHDNLNLFMKCYIDPVTSLHPWEPTDVAKGDYLEFFAEMDVLIAVSVCPSGAGTVHWDEEQHEIRPLGIEIYDTGMMPPEYKEPLAL